MKKITRHLSSAALVLLAGCAQLLSQSRSSITQDHFLMINDKKVFPVGFYSDMPVANQNLAAFEYEVKTLAAAGFNVMETGDRNAISGADYTTLFNLCGMLNFNIFIDFYFDVNTSFINTHRTKPCIAGYISDDANRYTSAQMSARENTIKTADPDHIHFCTGGAGDLVNHLTLIKEFAATTDGWFVQWYPVANDGSSIRYTSNVFLKTEDEINTPAANALSGSFIQIYNWGNTADRWPTAPEVRAMTYTSLISGIKSLMFYTFWDYDNSSTIDISQPALWNEAKNAARNLKTTLAGVILNGTLTKNIPTGNESIKASYWIYKGDVYLIAINLGGTPLNAAISFDATGKTIVPLFADIPGTLQFNTGTKKLERTMQALEVQGVKISAPVGISGLVQPVQSRSAVSVVPYSGPAGNGLTTTDLTTLNARYRIMSTTGATVLEGTVRNSRISTARLDQGLYLIRIRENGREYTRSFMHVCHPGL